MKKGWFMAGTLGVFLLLPLWSSNAQTKAKGPLAQVPITYAGDTEKTMARRAQWIEGAKKEGNTLTWWGVLKPEEARKELIEFNKVYPWIKVEYWRGEGEEIATKLEMELSNKRRTVDVAYGGEPINFPRWRKQGFMGKFTDLIPGIDKWDRRYYNSNGDSAQAGNNAVTPQYNTKLVSSAEAPKGWDDLLSPKWKGQLGMPTDPKNWWTLALAEGGWGIEKTVGFLTKLKAQQPTMQTGMSQGHSLLITGDFKVYTNDYLRHVIVSQEKGAPVDWCRVNPISLTGPSIIWPASGPHPNAARLFIEWFLSPQGTRVHEEVTGYGFASSGSGSRLSEIVKGHSFVVRTEEVIVKASETGLDDRFSKLIMGQ